MATASKLIAAESLLHSVIASKPYLRDYSQDKIESFPHVFVVSTGRINSIIK